MKTIATRELCAWLDATLNAASFADYCPNGLQVEGKSTVSHIIAGVTASQTLINVASERGADAILVHHGWFWKGEDPRILGTRKKRLASLLANDLNLIAYHLPLDAHPQLGNNAQLARILGLTPRADTAGARGLVWLGNMPGAATLGEVAAQVERALGRVPQVIGDGGMPAQSLAWCTGAAQSMLGEAIDAGAQVFITGEISEQTVHLARETGTGFISAGHHATERYGVQALGAAIEKEFGINVEFVDIDNPV
ncbi:MAG: Nif3-like dinuclear metal center hexameric protein [Burkholderiaceae bacterium]|nr:Nif3-like dinuclear metal center hexameric protein [Burkholderiaceae bacterium]MDP4970287.1 Nif3-like dinuclear metal center hexameric protein [Burkholderiaceae bacterium]MDP5111136.1 Nif3-like dinuclear metal center hexameric protein [Burkholderiaceae bacterium]